MNKCFPAFVYSMQIKPDAVCVYVNIHAQYICFNCINRQLHSSFVVFYFVFVL